MSERAVMTRIVWRKLPRDALCSTDGNQHICVNGSHLIVPTHPRCLLLYIQLSSLSLVPVKATVLSGAQKLDQ